MQPGEGTCRLQLHSFLLVYDGGDALLSWVKIFAQRDSGLTRDIALLYKSGCLVARRGPCAVIF